MKGARYPQINGMDHECDDYIPTHTFLKDRNNYTELFANNKNNDPLFGIPITIPQYKENWTKTGDPLAQEVSYSNAPYAEVTPKKA